MRSLQHLSLALTLACTHATAAPVTGGALRILFIGNSLTYVNDVPALVTAIARQMGDSDLGTQMVAFPDFALEDHWNEGSALRALTRQRWEYVVMQQGPSSLPENRASLESWTRRFATHIRAAGGEPVLYEVWPQLQRRADAPAVLLSYANAAAAVQGRLAPVGAAWDGVLASAGAVPLYSSDGLHATPYGSWLAAVVIYATIRQLDPRTLPSVLPVGVAAPALAPETVRTLLQRAAEAIAAAAR